MKSKRPRRQITENATRNNAFVLVIRNRQRVRKVSAALLRQIARALLEQHLSLRTYELGIHLVGAKEMALVNETFLNHAGSTDVITFDNSTLAPAEPSPSLTGELFICLDDAVSQAREFRSSWQAEVVRYLVHGVLHLRGHDDLKPVARRKMKQEENRLLRLLARQFPLARL